jgi:uncharacterized protein YcfL
MNERARRWSRAAVLGGALVLAVAGSSGCAGTRVNEAEQEPRQINPVYQKFLEYESDSALADAVFIESVNFVPGSSPLRVQANLINTTKSEYSFRYKVRWFDQNGMLVNPDDGVWIKGIIYGRERFPLQLVGPTPDAVDWRLVLSEWDR